MAGYQEVSINGVGCAQIENRFYTLWLSLDFGPRVLGLSYRGSDNLLANLPDARIPVEGKKGYALRGGHRLWYAPERPETTYIADDQPPRVRESSEGIEFIQEIDQPTGIQKSWVIELAPEEDRVVIDHRLTNCGEGPFELAPWAITMLRPGGVGLLPLQEGLDDEHGLWPNRQLVFWPYTDLNSPYLQIINQGLFVSADMKEGALKVGAPNPRGWIAYRLEDLLFVKESHYKKGERYLDRGASHQIYCSPDVIELETLGPAAILAPGEAVGHQETWQIYPEDSWPEEIQRIFSLASK